MTDRPVLDVSSDDPPWRIRMTPTMLSIDFHPADPASCAAIAERIDRLLAASQTKELLGSYVEPLWLFKRMAAAVGVGSRT